MEYCNGCESKTDRVDYCTHCGCEVCEKCCGSEWYVCRECDSIED